MTVENAGNGIGGTCGLLGAEKKGVKPRAYVKRKGGTRMSRLSAKNGSKIYQCPKCGATYEHDEAVNHAVYFAPRGKGAMFNPMKPHCLACPVQTRRWSGRRWGQVKK